jgi:hypothetical protein
LGDVILHGPWCLRLINNQNGSYISSMVDEDSHLMWSLIAFLVQYVPSGCSSSIQSVESFSGWECIKPEWLQLTIYVLFYILFPIEGLWEVVELWIKWCWDGTWASVDSATLCKLFWLWCGTFQWVLQCWCSTVNIGVAKFFIKEIKGMWIK